MCKTCFPRVARVPPHSAVHRTHKTAAHHPSAVLAFGGLRTQEGTLAPPRILVCYASARVTTLHSTPPCQLRLRFSLHCEPVPALPRRRCAPLLSPLPRHGRNRDPRAPLTPGLARGSHDRQARRKLKQSTRTLKTVFPASQAWRFAVCRRRNTDGESPPLRRPGC